MAMAATSHTVPPATGGTGGRWALVALLLALGAHAASEESTTTLSLNSYTVADDVALGREAEAEARRQLPLVQDLAVNAYIEGIGRRISANIPARMRQPAFEYSVDIVNLGKIVSFSLPGGTVFISRGLIEIAETEGELTAVVAHQLSHIVLRHATAQASRGETFQLGAILGRTIGAVASDGGASLIQQSANFGVNTYFLMFDGEREREADLLAARILAHAGYDPMDILTIFEAIDREGPGRGGPQWLRSHPDPDTGGEYDGREEYLWRQAEALDIEVRAEPEGLFESMQSRLAAMPPGNRSTRPDRWEEHGVPTAAAGIGRGVDFPSGEYGTTTAGDTFLLDVPSNWRRVSASNTAIFGPDYAFANTREGIALTHGLQIGVARSLSGEVEIDTQALLESLGHATPNLRWAPGHQRTRLGDRIGLTTTASTVSSVTGEFEQILVSTAPLPDGNFLYVIGVAPQGDAGLYRTAFDRVLESIRIVD